MQQNQCDPNLTPYAKEFIVQNLETEVTKLLKENIDIDICDYD